MAMLGAQVPGGVQTLRAQAKKEKAAKAAGQNAGGKASEDKVVTKAVLASPLTVPWPNLPRHLQTTVFNALPQLVPSEVADYHVSRQRCHRLEKKQDRKVSRAEKAVAAEADPSKQESSSREVDMAGTRSDLLVPQSSSAGTKSTTKTGPKGAHPPRPVAAPAPIAPEILSHLVLGTNEIIKALERQTDELRLKIMMLGEAINAQNKPKAPGVGLRNGKRKRDARVSSGQEAEENGTSEITLEGKRFLPTAPIDVDLEGEDGPDPATNPGEGPAIAPEQDTDEARTTPPATGELSSGISNPTRQAKPLASLQYIVIPLPDINPQSLVAPIPAYCATYNTLAYQHDHLLKVARARVPRAVIDKLQSGGGSEYWPVEEVRVVPLGRVEVEMAAMAGLRRMACLGVRSSHPQIGVLQTLLPKSVLHPPRHSLTLPFPIPTLSVHTGQKSEQQTRVRSSDASTSAPSRVQSANHTASSDAPVTPAALLPHTHYAPLHVKGITTTVPADGASRKAKRLEAVRAKRRDNKEARKLARKEMEDGIRRDLKRKALGLKGAGQPAKRSKAKPEATASGDMK